MATKKCPKCGEENPAEAVMCWACYTPLAGGAAAAAGGGLVTPRGGAAAVAPTIAEDEEKAPVDPKIFLVAGLLVVALAIGAFTSGIFGGSKPADGLIGTTLPENQGTDRGSSGGTTGFQPPPPPSPGGTAGGGTTGGTTGPAAPPPPFQTVVPPDPRYSNGTMAIVANAKTITPVEAKRLAEYAKQVFTPGGKWTTMQIFVFSDLESSRSFKKYQGQRGGAKLSVRQYQELAAQGVWNNVPSYLESKGSANSYYQPSASPNGWWTRKID